jgi:diguanylate cyclase (GGDEF)-like protein
LFVSGVKTCWRDNVSYAALAESLDRLHKANRELLDREKSDIPVTVPNLKETLRTIRPLASLAQRNNYPIAVLLVSIDNIDELYSDQYYEGADKAVNAIFSIINSATRDSDVVGRYDFRTFVVYLSNVKQTFLNTISRRLIKHIFIREIPGFTASMSIGGSYGRFREDLRKESNNYILRKELNNYIKKAADCLARARMATTNKVLIE